MAFPSERGSCARGRSRCLRRTARPLLLVSVLSRLKVRSLQLVAFRTVLEGACPSALALTRMSRCYQATYFAPAHAANGSRHSSPPLAFLRNSCLQKTFPAIQVYLLPLSSKLSECTINVVIWSVVASRPGKGMLSKPPV